MPRDPNKLTIAERKFCSVFVETGCMETAFEAGFGYSRRTNGNHNSARVMRKPAVQARILQLQLELEKKLEINRDTVISELAAIAFAPDISTYLDYDADSVRIRPLSELTPTEARALKSVTVLPNGGIKLELYDKLAAMGQLCKVLGLASGDTSISLNQFVIKVPEALQGGQEWEAEAARVLEADEAEAATRLLPEPQEPEPGLSGAPEPSTASLPPAPDAEPLWSPASSGRSASELQVLPQTLKLGRGFRRG